MIQIYYANIRLVQDTEVFEQLLHELEPKRQQKILNYKNMHDKYASLLAGVLLKYALEKRGFLYQSLSFEKNAHGKPFISNQEGIFFNISHSGEYVVCVFSDKNIGIDIENKQRMLFNKKKGFLEQIAKRCFSEQEYVFFQKSIVKEDLFLKFWTRKESYSKADGRGMNLDFRTIDVLSEDADRNFWSGWLSEEYYVSVYQKDICFKELMFEEIRMIERR